MIARTPDPALWLTASDISREMGLTVATVCKYIAGGRFPGAKYGNAYLVSRIEWEAFRAGTWKPHNVSPIQPTSLIARKSA